LGHDQQNSIEESALKEENMKRFARALAVTLGLVVLSSFVFLVPQKNAKADGSAPVTVVNTPLPVNGTVSASISGNVNATITNASVPVSAAQTGLWNVGITGTPSVNIASLPALNDGNALNPYRTNCTESDNLGGFVCDLGTVPSGKELVIEEVTGHIPGAPPGTVQFSLSRIYIQTIGAQQYDLATFLTGNDVGISERVRIYVDPGTDVLVRLVGNCPCHSTFSLSGYTVNLGQ
jgi:hypothetical protein